MSPFGVSGTEVLRALAQCKDIYDAFFSEYKNASKQLVAFNDELSRIKAALDFQTTIQAQTGQEYSGKAAFNDTLQECNAYLEGSRKALFTEHARGTTAFKKAYATVKSTFETDIPVLQNRLAHHRQEFLDFKVNLLLLATFNSAVQPPPERAESSALSQLQPTGNFVAQSPKEVMDLIGIITSYQKLAQEQAAHRIESPAEELDGQRSPTVGLPIGSSIDRLNARFWTTIASICRRENVAVDYRPPFISLEGLDRHLDFFSKPEAPAASAAPAPRPRGLMIFPRSTSIRILVYKEPRKLQPPIEIMAETYIFVSHRFIFHDRQRRAVFEHRVSHDCRPYTYHKQRELPGQIGFLEEQDVSLLPSRGQAVEEACKVRVEYRIDDEESYMRFQSDLRGNHLLGEFNFVSLKTKHSRAGNDADVEHLKLWRHGERPGTHILSSPAEFQSTKMIFEWPLRWIEQVDGPEKSNTVKFIFLHGPPCPCSSPEVNKRGSQSKRRSSSSGACTCKSSGTSSSSSSLYSTDLGQESSQYAQSSWLQKIQYLEFKFEEHERRLFLSQLQSIQDASSPNSPGLVKASPFFQHASKATPDVPLQFRSLPTPIESRHNSFQSPAISRGTSPMFPPAPRSGKGKQRAEIPLEPLPEAASSNIEDFTPTRGTVSRLADTLRMSSLGKGQRTSGVFQHDATYAGRETPDERLEREDGQTGLGPAEWLGMS